MFKLSNRLKKIIDMCEKVETIADIASDYGYVPIYLSNNNFAKNIIISDICSNSINKIKSNIKKYSTNDNFSVRQGDGLNILDYNEADIIIITGIGCDLLTRMLENINQYNFKFLILSPQTKFFEFKQFLKNKNLNIIDEEIIEDNKKFYFIYKIEKTKGPIYNIDEYYSLNLLKNKNLILKKYIETQIETLKNILNNIIDKNTRFNLEKKLQYNKKILKEFYEN